MDLHRKLVIRGQRTDIRGLTSVLCLLTSVCLTSVFGQTGSIFVDENHNGHKIFGLPTPTSANEAATKAYVDAGGGGGGAVSSVFGRTGAVVAATNDYSFAQIGSKPTTLSGYGITDAQPLDGDLSALAALTGTNTIYYRSAANTWSPVTIGSNMTFSGGTLDSVAGGGGTVTNGGTLTGGQLIIGGGGTVITIGNLSGDVTTSGTTATTIGNNKVTYAKMQNVGANSVLLGSSATGSGAPPGEIALGTNLSMSGSTLNATGGTGTVTTTGSPATGNLTKFSGATSITNGDLSGDVTTSGTLATTIANSAVTYAKMQNVSANSVLLGSSATGSGAPPSQIALGTNLSMSGSTLNAAGGGGGAVGGSITGHGNTDYTILSTDKIVVTNAAFTTLHTWTMPAANTVSAGNSISIIDLQGTLTATNRLLIARTGSDIFVPDASTQINMTQQGQGIQLTSDGASRWIVSYSSPGTASTGGQVMLYDNNNKAWNMATPKFVFGTTTPATGLIVQSNGADWLKSTVSWPSAAGVAGRLVQSDGTNLINGIVIPTTAGTAGKVLISDGTNVVSSTPTYPTTAGTAGYDVRSDGTNYAAYPMQIINSSTASQSPSTSDVYLTGSNCVVAAGDFKAKGQYRCLFDMTKSAGTGAIVISLRVGTAGTTADTAVVTFTFGAGTSVADSGIFEVIATWRSVGSGTSAVVQGICKGTHNLATTGLFSNADAFVIIGTTSSGFASNTATNIGLSFNGSTAFAGTTTLVQASLQQ